ncbi:MAG: STAUR_1299 family protein, partial [Thermodesulfobacteriota bacterium]
GHPVGCPFLLEDEEMADYRDRLFSKAFKVIPGIDYNRVSNELREKEEGSFIIYEVVIRENEKWDYLRDKVYPNLVRYLKQKGMGPSSGEGFIIALFFKDSVYFIRGTDFFKIFCEMEDLNSQAFHFRVLRWLSE